MKRVTIRDIAGFCPEEAVWKMMTDMSEYLLKENNVYVLTPDSIIIDGDTFMLETGHETTNEFIAPEKDNKQNSNASQIVWSLGAVAYYMATGHVIFGGHGSSYQKEHPTVQLPVLPKGFKDLTSILHRCICYNPENRITLKELNNLLSKGLTSCRRRNREQIEVPQENKEKIKQNIGEKWPEEMIEV